MDVRHQKKLREDFLVTLLEMHHGNFSSDKNTEELCKKLGLDYNTNCSAIALPLQQDGLVSWGAGFAWISLTPKGRQEAERIVESRYAVKAQRVLQKIYDMSKGIPGEIVVFDSLVKELGMSDDEVTGICIGLEEEGFIKWPGGDVLEIKARGCRAIDDSGRKQGSGGDIYHTTIGKVEGGAHIGPGGTQNIQINYQPVSEIIPQLAALIESVKGEQFDDRDEVVRDLEIAHQVALANPDATAKDGAWTRIQTKLTAAKTTMELAGFVIKTYPYWPLVWDFFHQHVR